MIVLRPTKKALAKLDLPLTPSPPATTSRLGDWYLNVVPTLAGELYVFVSSSTLLAVAVPTREPIKMIYPLFVMRVANLLSMIGLSNHRIEDELRHYQDMALAKPDSRTVQGSANEIAFQLQNIADREARPGKPLSLSDAEFFLSRIPHKPLRYDFPRRVALELLSTRGDVA